MDKKYDIVIVGAGPAGLTAAITAKRVNPDAKVALLEKKDPLLGAYLDGIIKRELKILKGMEKGANVSDEELLAQKTAIDELKKIKEETDTWQR